MSDLLALLAIYQESQRTDKNPFVGFEANVRIPDGDDIRYEIHSVSPNEEPRLAAQQKIDAFLSFRLYGNVTDPDALSGYRVEAGFNELGSIDSPDLAAGGIIERPKRLGTGLFELDRGRFLINIIVPPYVVKDILDQLCRSSGDRKTVRFIITNLRQRDPDPNSTFRWAKDIEYDLDGIFL